mmetsp:Transcript_10150/g.23773  ORF Transcript_10150/g.23773 Transcript_10150/m.23773 type:complete len:112 (+) Transcript_10150:129-464(+)
MTSSSGSSTVSSVSVWNRAQSSQPIHTSQPSFSINALCAVPQPDRCNLTNLVSQVGDVVKITSPSNHVFPKRRAACQPLIMAVAVHNYNANVVPIKEVMKAVYGLGWDCPP